MRLIFNLSTRTVLLYDLFSCLPIDIISCTKIGKLRLTFNTNKYSSSLLTARLEFSRCYFVNTYPLPYSDHVKMACLKQFTWVIHYDNENSSSQYKLQYNFSEHSTSFLKYIAFLL